MCQLTWLFCQGQLHTILHSTETACNHRIKGCYHLNTFPAPFLYILLCTLQARSPLRQKKKKIVLFLRIQVMIPFWDHHNQQTCHFASNLNNHGLFYTFLCFFKMSFLVWVFFVFCGFFWSWIQTIVDV